MSLCNADPSNLALTIDKDAPIWLVDFLKGMGSMKTVRNGIKLYNTEVQKTLEYFKHVVSSEEISIMEHAKPCSGDTDICVNNDNNKEKKNILQFFIVL